MTNYRYAGFWIRFIAVIIDGIIISIICAVLGAAMGVDVFGDAIAEEMTQAEVIYNILTLIIYLAYYIYFHGSKYQATIGKMALGIYVVGENGERITYMRSFLRYIGYFISGLILCIGYIMAAFTDKKRALHDIIAKTYVVFGKPSSSNITTIEDI